MDKRNRSEYQRKYRESNKAKAKAYQKIYRENNKEKAAAYQANYAKEYRESQKDGLFTVYCLPEENYVGMTTWLRQRITMHRTENNRNVKGVYVLGKYATKRESLDIEASYHAKGYLGRNSTYKKLQ